MKIGPCQYLFPAVQSDMQERAVKESVLTLSYTLSLSLYLSLLKSLSLDGAITCLHGRTKPLFPQGAVR